MFLELLLFVTIFTIFVTWSFNRPQAAKGKPATMSRPSLFRAWLKATDKIEPSLQTWLFALSEEEFNTMSEQVATYCKSLGMELDWLLHASHQLHINQPLQDTMPEVVIAYLISRHKAAQVQDEAQIFKAYQAFNENPASHADLARELFSKLVDNGLVTMSSSDLLDDDPQKRQEYMISTIRQTAKNDPIGFNKALKAVVLL